MPCTSTTYEYKYSAEAHHWVFEQAIYFHVSLLCFMAPHDEMKGHVTSLKALLKGCIIQIN
jgi:hypothetical protein